MFLIVKDLNAINEALRCAKTWHQYGRFHYTLRFSFVTRFKIIQYILKTCRT